MSTRPAAFRCQTARRVRRIAYKLKHHLEHMPVRIASVSHAIFAVTMIGLGAVGLLHPDFVPLWNPVPNGVPARELFIYVGALISLTAGIGHTGNPSLHNRSRIAEGPWRRQTKQNQLGRSESASGPRSVSS